MARRDGWFLFDWLTERWYSFSISVDDDIKYRPNSDYVDKRILNLLRTNQRAKAKIPNEIEWNPSNRLAITTAFLPFKYRVNTRKYSYRYEKERYIRIRSIYESIYWITSMRRWFMCETRAKYSMNWESKAEFVPPRLYTRTGTTNKRHYRAFGDLSS